MSYKPYGRLMDDYLGQTYASEMPGYLNVLNAHYLAAFSPFSFVAMGDNLVEIASQISPCLTHNFAAILGLNFLEDLPLSSVNVQKFYIWATKW